MKKLLMLVLVMVFAVSSVCFAAETAKDPITATVQAAGEVVTAPVEAVVNPSGVTTESEANDPITATAEVAGKTVQTAGDVIVAPVKAVTGQE